jgi:hypothetical protein
MSASAPSAGKPWDLEQPTEEGGGLRRRSTTSWREVVRSRIRSLAIHIYVLQAEATTPADRRWLEGALAQLGESWDATMKAPFWQRIANWWSGASIERAWLSLDEAEIMIAQVVPMETLATRKPAIRAIADQCFDRDDPRRRSTDTWMTARRRPESRSESEHKTGVEPTTTEPAPPPRDEEERERIVTALRWARSATFDRLDGLRSFRNLVLAASLSLLVLASALAALGAVEPTLLPLCFAPANQTATTVATTSTTSTTTSAISLACPTGQRQTTIEDGPSTWDVALVELLGFVGGALAASVALHRIRGTKTPYDVPAALALLKLPFGALTALAALLLVHGAFLPGLSNLDSQAQIVAYALVFGYAQQLITRLIDRQGQSVLNSVPGSEVTGSSPFTPPPVNDTV